MPVIPCRKRAVKADALAAASSSDNKRAALESYRGSKSAISSIAPRETCLSTWRDFHMAWFGNDEYLPITTEKIEAVASMFKQGRYKSYGNYLTRVKEEHIAQCGRQVPWDQALELEARKSVMSVTRGLGTARQSGAFDVDKVTHVAKDVDVPPGAPYMLGESLTTGCLWLTREIELSALDMGDASFNLQTLECGLELTVSKTDPQAKGCVRTWGCVCKGDPNKLCGYHAVMRAHASNVEIFGVRATTSFPLFPDSAGNRAKKEGIVDAIELCVEATGGQTHNKLGEKIFGAHSLRVSGAQYLAQIGIEVLVIMCLARHSSNIILRYVQQAPLKALTNSFVALTDKKTPGPLKCDDERYMELVASLESKLAALSDDQSIQKGHVAALTADLERFKAMASGNSSEVHIGSSTKTVHSTLVYDVLAPQSSWKTHCGWHFGFTRFDAVEDIAAVPWSRVCGTCMPTRRKSMREAAFQIESEASD